MPRPTTYLTTFTVVQPTSRKQLGHIISSHKIQTENNFKIKTLNLLCCILAGCSWTAVFAQLIDFFSHLLSLHQKLNSRQGASYSSCILNIHQFHIYNMGKKISACLWSLISPKQSRIILIFFEIAYFFIHAQNWGHETFSERCKSYNHFSLGLLKLKMKIANDLIYRVNMLKLNFITSI